MGKKLKSHRSSFEYEDKEKRFYFRNVGKQKKENGTYKILFAIKTINNQMKMNDSKTNNVA